MIKSILLGLIRGFSTFYERTKIVLTRFSGVNEQNNFKYTWCSKYINDKHIFSVDLPPVVSRKFDDISIWQAVKAYIQRTISLNTLHIEFEFLYNCEHRYLRLPNSTFHFLNIRSRSGYNQMIWTMFYRIGYYQYLCCNHLSSAS